MKNSDMKSSFRSPLTDIIPAILLNNFASGFLIAGKTVALLEVTYNRNSYLWITVHSINSKWPLEVDVDKTTIFFWLGLPDCSSTWKENSNLCAVVFLFAKCWL